MKRHSFETKRRHLDAFADACESYAARLAEVLEYASNAERFLSIARRARDLRSEAFSQADLDALARSEAVVFQSFPHWTPPLEEVSPGLWREPAWLRPVLEAEDVVLETALQLRTVGER